MIKLIFYAKGESETPVLEFIRSLEKDERIKIYACLKSVEDMGNDSPRVTFRQIRGKLWEIKIETHKSGYRFFYVYISLKTMVLLHAYKKKTKKAPIKELNIAEKRMLEVLNNESYYSR